MKLSQLLSSEARERLARIALVKPEKARGVEDVIIRAAQMGQIAEKVFPANPPNRSWKLFWCTESILV
ncbi:DNA-binding protein [Quillaja saponaria]|uniref:DNA-binding protein n=1 Tax=Quillaja saponaria TaxID=32244 RepID=A0AAD7PLL1_QUISA|nr:DNA-binding protein [Quillaja saponaria]